MAIMFLLSFFLRCVNIDKTNLFKPSKTFFWSNKDMFATMNNPDIGVPKVVQHTKHHKPYRLLPQKREVLRHRLN